MKRAVLVGLVALASCGRCREEAVPDAPPLAIDARADAEDAPAEAESVDAADAEDAPSFALTLASKCAGHLPTARPPSDEEILALVLPDYDASAHALRAGDAGTPLVSLCAGDPVLLSEPPRLGAPTRVPIPGAATRELVQIPLGMRPGLVTTGAGVLAVVERRGAEVRVVGTAESGGTKDGSPDLDPARVERMGATAVAVVDSPDAPWGEQPFAEATSAVRLLDDPRLAMVAVIPTSLRSNGVFWHAPYAAVMRSNGLRAEADGFAVDEEWTFTRGAETKKRSVVRRYTLRGKSVTETPKLDLQAWPETRDPTTP